MFKKSRLNFWLLYLCNRQFLPQSLLHLSAAIAGNGNHQAFLTANVQKNQLVVLTGVWRNGEIHTGHLRKGSKKNVLRIGQQERQEMQEDSSQIILVQDKGV